MFQRPYSHTKRFHVLFVKLTLKIHVAFFRSRCFSTSFIRRRWRKGWTETQICWPSDSPPPTPFWTPGSTSCCVRRCCPNSWRTSGVSSASWSLRERRSRAAPRTERGCPPASPETLRPPCLENWRRSRAPRRRFCIRPKLRTPVGQIRVYPKLPLNRPIGTV